MKRLIVLNFILLTALSFLVSCNPIGNDPAEIVIVTSNAQIIAESADTSVTFGYDIVNPRDNAVVTLEIPEANDWISNSVIDQDARTVTLSLTQNFSAEGRQEIVTVKYSYGKESVTQIASIIQEGASYDYSVECGWSKSLYYGKGMVEDLSLHCYYFRVSNNDFNAETKARTWRYSIDFYHAGESGSKLPEPGVYQMVEYGEEADYTFSTWGTKAEYIGEDLIDGTDYEDYEFVEGIAVVEVVEGVYSVTAMLTDTQGKRHYVHYSGEPEVEDATVLSTLEGDVVEELYNYDIVLVDYGDYYNMGMNNWQLQIYAGPSVGDFVLLLDVATPMSEDLSVITEPVLFESYYANSGIADCFYFPGEYKFKLSWLVTWGGDGVDYISPYAAILGGSCLLEPNDDGTVKLTTDFIDQHGHKIKLTMDDMLIYYYPQYSSVSAIGKKPLGDFKND